jgi:protein-S-isoprenylcysteine O-methyltransferase Ste14
MRKPAAAIGSAIFFGLAPVVVAGLVPWWLTGWHPGHMWIALRVLGAVLVLAGTAALLDAFTRFVVEGRGTPAPVAPTERLVVGGLYRFVRNPMYVAVLTVIIGQALIMGRWSPWIYAVTVWLATAAFVRWYEEPTLRARFGSDYDAYRKAVPAWLPSARPWTPADQGPAQAR